MSDDPSQLYRLSRTPSGRRLWTYMAAILQVTGLDRGEVYPLNKFFGNFKTHIDEGRIVSVSGGFRLTSAGADYFRDRYREDNPQNIQRAEVERMISSILTGRGEGDWEPVR